MLRYFINSACGDQDKEKVAALLVSERQGKVELHNSALDEWYVFSPVALSSHVEIDELVLVLHTFLLPINMVEYVTRKY